ncbi:threonine dehydratase, partial [Burkholderia multivorans]
VTLDNIDRFADGTAVRRAGNITYEIVSDLGVDVRPVAEGAVASEMLQMYQVDGIIAEPSGALASAAVGAAGSGRPIVA